ncbi:hypothetical protein C8F01DRAFT_1170517 [Mycena amicta]|nr:hypothetical protein C8F01DRAFT_1170517 [Mycena amicta]
MRTLTKSQTLYTARFYETPSSSDASSKPSKPSDTAYYLERLFDTHAALQRMDEVPSSRPTTPDTLKFKKTLATAAKQAYQDAKGNPASGQWGILVNLLQTTAVRGRYKYIETRDDVAPPQPGPDGWPEIPATEEEWFAWEKRYKEQRDLKAKVESWKQDIDDDDGSHVNEPPIPRNISDVPEIPFLPPSFNPAHLTTSTPPVVHNRRQPSPIVLAPSSSPLTPLAKPSAAPSQTPTSSPRNTRVYGRSRVLESPPKRQRSPSPMEESPPKKARVAASSPAVPPSLPKKTPFKVISRPPFTPPRSNLPKLTDLIAASEQKRRLKGKGKAKEKPQSLASSKPKASRPNSTSPKQQDDGDGDARMEANIEEMADKLINWAATAEERAAMIPAVPSPTKSLSSIDGSNSVDSQDSSPKFSQFDPQAVSTQPLSRLEAGESLGTTERLRGFGQPDDDMDFGFPMRYESQLDVETNLQGVKKLLDEDVGGYTGPWGHDDEQWDARADIPPSSP